MERIKIDIHKEKGRISPELHSQFIEIIYLIFDYPHKH